MSSSIQSLFLQALRPAVLLLALVLLPGCYNRWTGAYDEFPELSDSTSAIVDESGLSEADIALRKKLLQEWDSRPAPQYRINAGDGLAITVYNHPDLAQKTVVTPDGFVGMVFLGEVKLAGLTLAEAAKRLEEGLSKYIKNPAVGVTPYEIGSETVTIVGAVNHPGMYVISNGMRLADLYAKAGGSTERYFDGQELDAADLVNAIFVREGQALPVDFKEAIEKGNPAYNLRLRKGDYVYIAVRSESMVCLIGEVHTPHKRLWDNNLGLLELLTTGGWFKETYWPRVIIIRGGIANPTLYKVDVDAILQGKRPNVRLLAGDIVYVPKDNISEYNVFVRKLLPTGQLMNLIMSPFTWHNQIKD